MEERGGNQVCEGRKWPTARLQEGSQELLTSHKTHRLGDGILLREEAEHKVTKGRGKYLFYYLELFSFL